MFTIEHSTGDTFEKIEIPNGVIDEQRIADLLVDCQEYRETVWG